MVERVSRLAGVLMVVVLLTATLSVRQVPSAQAAVSNLRWGYYITYDSSSFPSLSQHIGQLDIVAPYFYHLNPDGTIQHFVDDKALTLMRDSGVKIVPMIKNLSRWDDFHQTIETAEKRDAIIQRLVDLVEDHDYDGMHIDFEAVNASDAPLITDFMQRLANRLRPMNKLTTQAVVARTSDTSTTWGGAYDYKALSAHNDYIVIMAYDFSYMSGPPGPIAPITWVERVVDYAKTRLSSGQIVLGMPLYGYDWNVTKKTTVSLRYDQTAALLSRAGTTSGFDVTEQTPWLRYTDAAGDSHEVWYENAASLRAKLNLMIESGVAGFGVWRLGHEDPEFWTEVARLATPATRIPSTPNTSGRLYFDATGHSLAYGFKTFWEGSGGLPVFGYPLTEEFDELNEDTRRVHTVQYFERQRYEYHPEYAGTVYEVLLGRLGVIAAEAAGLDQTIPFQPVAVPAVVNDDCHYFVETSHSLCGAFKTYWESHGLEFGDDGFSYRESLALFGYPISEPFIDPHTGLSVQYFERARFEYHPENAGTEYDVLLGLLGTDAVRAKGWIQ